MSPTAKARPAPAEVPKKKPLESRREVAPGQSELAFLIVGGIALMESFALILLARRKI